VFHSITGFLKNNGDISYRVPQKAILKGVKTNKLKIIQGLNTKIQPLNRIELYRRVLKLNITTTFFRIILTFFIMCMQKFMCFMASRLFQEFFIQLHNSLIFMRLPYLNILVFGIYRFCSFGTIQYCFYNIAYGHENRADRYGQKCPILR